MTTATKAKRPAPKPTGEVGKKALSAALGVIETASKRITKLAHEGKKKLSTAHTEERKAKAS